MKKRMICLGITGILCVIVLIILCVAPLRIRLQFKTNRLYEGVPVTKDDVVVETASVLNLWNESAAASIDNQDDDILQVSSGMLSRTFAVDKIPVSYIAAEYSGVEYQFDEPSLKPVDFHVQAIYADGHVEELLSDKIKVHKDGLSTKSAMTVQVEAFGETCDVLVRPVQVSGLMVSYKNGLHVGDTFDKKQLEVSVKFADGMTRKIDDWTCDFEGVVSADSKIEVISKQYGKGYLTVDMSNIKDYKLEYTRSVYEGDVLKPSDVKLSVVYSDDRVEEVKDVTFDEIRVFKGTKVAMKSSLLGSMNCVVNPIGVEKVVADTAASMNRELTVRGLTLVYQDGHQVSLDMKNVSFVTDLSKPLKSGQNEIVFRWYDHEYRFQVLIL